MTGKLDESHREPAACACNDPRDATLKPERCGNTCDYLLRMRAEGAERVAILHVDAALDRAIAHAYVPLLRLARSQLQRTGWPAGLEPSGLVHEFYLKLRRNPDFEARQFRPLMAYARQAMRCLIIDYLRRERSRALESDEDDAAHVPAAVAGVGSETLLDVRRALDTLKLFDERMLQVVELRAFTGLSEAEIARTLGVRLRTVQRDWRGAKTLLAAYLSPRSACGS